jgi:hypothetical protein
MDFLHQELDLGPEDVVEVILDHPANVQLLDSMNFNHYRDGLAYRYHGGYATTSPYQIRPPHPGRWHLTVDLGGNAGSVRASVRILSGSAETSV